MLQLRQARRQAARVEQQCKEFDIPIGTVCHEEDPLKANAQMSPDHFWVHRPAGTDTWEYQPAVLKEFVASQPSPQSWWIPYPEGCIFLHSRTSPQGHERMIIVNIGGDPDDLTTLFARVVIDGGEDVPPRPLLSRGRLQLQRRSGPHEALRIYGGRPDPRDASHFTIDYQLNEGSGTIDAYLSDDDEVTFATRGLSRRWAIAERAVEQYSLNPSFILKPAKFEPVSDVVKGQITVAFSPDGAQLASGTYGGAVCLWDLKRRIEMSHTLISSERIWHVIFSGDGRFLAAGDHDARLWDLRENRSWPISTWDNLNPAAFSGDGRILFHSSDSRTPTRVEAWDIKTGISLDPLQAPELIREPFGHGYYFLRERAGGPCLFVLEGNNLMSPEEFSPDFGVQVVPGKGYAELRDTSTGMARVLRLADAEDWGYYPKFSPDGRWFGVTSVFRAVHLWDYPEATREYVLPHSGDTDFAFSPDGNWLAAGGSADGAVLVWDLASLRPQPGVAGSKR